MAAKVFTFVNQKGGVGKTTLSVHFGFFLQSYGKRVLFIDNDPQGNGSSRFENDGRVGGLRTYHLFSAELPALSPLKTESGVDLIYSLNGDKDLIDVERLEIDAVENYVNNVCAIAEDYDYIVIDSPPANGWKMTGAVISADYIYVPVELSAFATTGVETLLESFYDISTEIGRKIEPTGIIVNRLNTRLKDHIEGLAELKAEVGHLIMRQTLGIKGAIDSAVRERKPVWELKGSGANREAGKEMFQLMEEIARQCKIKPSARKGGAK